jgi:hypothetical protein
MTVTAPADCTVSALGGSVPPHVQLKLATLTASFQPALCAVGSATAMVTQQVALCSPSTTTNAHEVSTSADNGRGGIVTVKVVVAVPPIVVEFAITPPGINESIAISRSFTNERIAAPLR